jgi:hypothetical protein
VRFPAKNLLEIFRAYMTTKVEHRTSDIVSSHLPQAHAA